MFDAPVDAWYVWLGVSAASLVAFGVASQFPTAPPQEAGDVADTVDSVAGCSHGATAEHPLSAREIRLGPHHLGLRNGDSSDHATFAYGPVVPVRDDGRLRRVLHGAPPADAFASPSALRTATRETTDRRPEWKRAGDRLLVRCVSWEGVRATLVDG